MTYDELVNSLGTIAKSGSLEFLEKIKDKSQEELKDIDIIGQFGVGFYSSFMVASKVEVRTRSLYDESGYLFTSSGEDTYTIERIDKENSGTTVTLYLRKNDDEYEYDTFCQCIIISKFYYYLVDIVLIKYQDNNNQGGQYAS